MAAATTIVSFLDHDGHYERTVRRDPDYEQKDIGRWFHDESQGVLRLESDTPDDTDRMSSSWWVLSVRTCEDSNRHPGPSVGGLGELDFCRSCSYRVHCDGRGYGTGWEQGSQNKTLQQTAAAILVPRDITAHSAAAAAERVVRARLPPAAG